MRRFARDSSALSSAVFVTLLMSMVAAVLSGMFASELPKWGMESERRHAEDVSRQFNLLQDNIETMAEAPDDGEGSFLITRMPLAAAGDNFIGIGKTQGTLTLEPMAEDVNTSVMFLTHQGDDERILVQSGGRITYDTNNVFFTQIGYVYELGALIEVTGENVLMVSPPDMAISTNATGAFQISLNSPMLTGSTRSLAYQGSAVITCRMDQPYDPKRVDSSNLEDPIDVSLRIGTTYPEVWQSFLADRFELAGMDPASYSFTAWDGPAGGHSGLRLDIDGLDYFELGVASVSIDME